MIFFCPNCWKEIAEDRLVCSQCGARISSWDEKAFTAKLVQALSHPEPETQMRAVYLLGETKAVSAFGALVQLYRNTTDLFLQAEVIKAADKIGGDSAFSLLIEALGHRSYIVRREAATALTKYPEKGIVKQALGRARDDRSATAHDIKTETIGP
jgi:HEAT repeat protein